PRPASKNPPKTALDCGIDRGRTPYLVHPPMISALSARPKGIEAVPDDSTFTEAAGLTFRTPEPAPIRSARQEACLVHIYPPDPNLGRRYPLGETPAVIGRGEDCAVRNTDPSVSRCHARVVRGDDGQYFVSDLGSTNGTFVNNASRRDNPL